MRIGPFSALIVAALPAAIPAPGGRAQAQTPAGVTVSGQVFDTCSAMSSGIPGATVTLQTPAGPVRTTTSVAAMLSGAPVGSFRIEGLPAGYNQLALSKPGWLDATYTINVEPAGGPERTVFLRGMRPAVVRIEGTVVVQNSVPARPEPGATVTLDPDTPGARSVLTDGSAGAGKYAFDDVPNAGTHVLRVTMPHHSEATHTVQTPTCNVRVPAISLTPEPDRWSLPIAATDDDFTMGWTVRANCPNPADSYIAPTSIPSRRLCPNPLPNGARLMRSVYVASSDYFSPPGSPSAHGDPARACVGYPRLCASAPQASLVRITLHLGRIALSSASEPAEGGGWDVRRYASQAPDAVVLKYGGTWFARGSAAMTQRVANPAGPCSAATATDLFVVWTEFSADPRGVALQADVAASGRARTSIRGDAPARPLAYEADLGCRHAPSNFSFGSGAMTPVN